MNEQDFQTRVINYLAGELSAEESVQVLEEVKSSVERQKFFEEYSRVWEESIPSEDFPVINDLDQKWSRFEKAAFTEKPKVIKLSERMKPLLRIAAAISLLAIGALAWSLLNKQVTAELQYVVIKSDDQPRELTLPDGSIVSLDKNSELTYEQTFDARVVQLEGKALFEVQHLIDDRPFEVQTRQTKTTVLGTVFMVDARSKTADVEIYVKEGRVAFQKLDSEQEGKILTAGDRGLYKMDQQTVEIKRSVIEANQLSWKTGEFVFVDSPLREILPLLEDYYGVSFEVNNKTLLDCTFKTDFSQADLEDIVIELSFGLNLEIKKVGQQRYTIDGTKCR
jgi:ferric-dicitrate binding protein FerR (iron transport regulator)